MNSISPGMILKKVSLELTQTCFLLEYTFVGDDCNELKSLDRFMSSHPGQLQVISAICELMLRNIGKSVVYWEHDDARSLTNFCFKDGTRGSYGDQSSLSGITY